jgi:hypothetical protein
MLNGRLVPYSKISSPLCIAKTNRKLTSIIIESVSSRKKLSLKDSKRVAASDSNQLISSALQSSEEKIQKNNKRLFGQIW